MTALLHRARRIVGGLAGWKLAVLLSASLLLNVGFMLVWVLQPLPPAPGTKAGGASVPEGNAVATGATLETRLRAAGFSEVEIQKIAGAAGMMVAPANRTDAVATGQEATPSTDAPRANEAGPTGGSRAISIGSTGAIPAANRATPGIQSRSSSPSLRGAAPSEGSPAGAGARAPGADLPVPLASPGLEVTPIAAAPNPTPAHVDFPQRELLTPQQQLYRSLYGWQNYNAAVTESVQEGGAP